MHILDEFKSLEAKIIAGLETAVRHGLASLDGRTAFLNAARSLDELDAVRGRQVYFPLAADPQTRDHVARLDGQLAGLSTRIDILRSHIECGLLTGQGDTVALDASLTRLLRQLRVRFRHEAAIDPVFTGWLAHNPAALAASAAS